MSKFENKVALVTGGASGIGEAIAKRLASEGAKVVVADINDVAAKDVAAAIEAAGGVAAAFRQDVASKEDNEAAVQFAVDTFGALHLAVNNAGVGDHTPLADKDLADWDKVIAINLSGVAYGCHYQLKQFLAGQHGTVRDCEHVLHPRLRGPRRRHRGLHRREARRGGADQVSGRGLRRHRHPGQLRGSGIYRHAADSAGSG